MDQGLEIILDRIRSESEEEASRIIKAAEQQAREIVSRAEREAEELQKKTREETSSVGAKDAQKLMANARLQARRSQAEAKEEGIRLVFSRVEDLLSQFVRDGEMQGVTYFQTLLDISLSALAQMEGEVEIRLNDDDRERYGEKLISRLNETEKKQQQKVHATLGRETINAPGGALFLAEEGKVMIDQTFPARIKNRRSDLRARAARILFE